MMAEEEIVEEIIEELEETEEVVEELDEEDGEKDIPPFMVEDEPTESVPLGAHVKAKDKLKGKIGERDEEIERLKQFYH